MLSCVTVTDPRPDGLLNFVVVVIAMEVAQRVHEIRPYITRIMVKGNRYQITKCAV